MRTRIPGWVWKTRHPAFLPVTFFIDLLGLSPVMGCLENSLKKWFVLLLMHLIFYIAELCIGLMPCCAILQIEFVFSIEFFPKMTGIHVFTYYLALYWNGNF